MKIFHPDRLSAALSQACGWIEKKIKIDESKKEWREYIKFYQGMQSGTVASTVAEEELSSPWNFLQTSPQQQPSTRTQRSSA